MKLRTLSVFATAALVSLAACGGGDEGAEGTTGDTTAVETAAPVTPPAMDTGMAVPPAPMDSTAMGADTTGGAMGGDTTGGDTTKM